MCICSVTVQLLPKTCAEMLAFGQRLKLQVSGEKSKKKKKEKGYFKLSGFPEHLFAKESANIGIKPMKALK